MQVIRPPADLLNQKPMAGAGNRAISVLTAFQGTLMQIKPPFLTLPAQKCGPDQQHLHCLGACEKRRLSSLAPRPTESASAF